MSVRIRSVLCALLFVCASSTVTAAQCPNWRDGFELPSLNGFPLSFAVFDDGSGPALYCGGEFWNTGTTSTGSIAKWDGASWSALGLGTNGAVSALVVFDDGTGRALYAGGQFTTAGGVAVNNIAKWDGFAWTAVGTGFNGVLTALAVYHDGTAERLIAAGQFTTAGGVPASNVAQWDGTNWSPLGSGTNEQVGALAVWDDGTGPALYVGGDFTVAGSTAANAIARWDGTNWFALGSGLPHAVTAMTGFDDGSGSALYVGRQFGAPDGDPVLRKWDGASWSTAAQGAGHDVIAALTVFDDGTGAALYAGGYFGIGDEHVHHLAKWLGSTHWMSLGGDPNAQVFAIHPFDDGSGPSMFVGGAFTGIGGVGAKYIARWDGSDFSALEGGNGADDAVHALVAVDLGAGTELYVGGTFNIAGGAPANAIARWDGVAWSALAAGVSVAQDGLDGLVSCIAAFDDGSGPALYCGGDFKQARNTSTNQVARWDGSSWSALGSGIGGGINRHVQALAVFDDGMGAALYVGGLFSTAGGVAANSIAKWDGASWSAVGNNTLAPVSALIVLDDGTGDALYVSQSGRVRKWDGTSWTNVGTGLGAPLCFAIFDDGTGSALYAGGAFASRVAKWTGSVWSPAGFGVNGIVRSLAVFHDGSGPALHAGGDFTMAGAVNANHVAKWDGAAWSALESGTDGVVRALAAADVEGDGVLDLYVGGSFENAGGLPSRHFAKRSSCGPGMPYCFGDGVDPSVTASCPCANAGAIGRGCGNSNSGLGGARLTAVGTTNPNSVLLTCDGIPNHNLTTFLRGTVSTGAGFVFGDGVACVSGTLVRFGQQSAGDGGNPSNTAISATGSVPPGNTRFYEVQYRNPSATFCPPAPFNVSSSYSITW